MSELAVADVADLSAARRRRDQGFAELLSDVALFGGIDERGLANLAPAFRRIELAPGQILWRQGERHDGLHVLLDGRVQVFRRLPGERELELARLGAGEVMGELPLLGGGARSASVRALTPCTLLFLSEAEFQARTLAGEPTTLALRQRIVEVACSRVRRAHAELAAKLVAFSSLAGARVPAQHGEPVPAALPPRSYLSRLPLFRDLDHELVAEVLDRGTVLSVPRGHVVHREATPAKRCYITLNGVVEDVLRRGSASVRVGFAGPGHAFGYLGLLDSQAAPVSSVARERCVLLAIDCEHFTRLRNTPGARFRAFAAAIDADVIRSLEVAERTLSHMAAARPA